MVGANDVMRLTLRPRLARDSDQLLDTLAGLGGPVVLSSLPEFRAMVAVPAVQRPVVVAREAMVRCVQRAVRARPDAVPRRSAAPSGRASSGTQPRRAPPPSIRRRCATA